jgi:uncharacterized protein (TIGR00251 family)
VIRETPDGLVLDLQVVPRASRVAVGPLVGTGPERRLRVAVMAPPVDGKANEAVIAALAGALNARRRDVSILRGETGRQKTARIVGVSLAELEAAVQSEVD